MAVLKLMNSLHRRQVLWPISRTVARTKVGANDEMPHILRSAHV